MVWSNWCRLTEKSVSNLVFYAQSAIAVTSGRIHRENAPIKPKFSARMRRFLTDYEGSKQSSANEIQDICSGFLITEEDSMYTTPTPPGSDAFLYTHILYDEGCTCHLFLFTINQIPSICRCSYGVLIKMIVYIYISYMIRAVPNAFPWTPNP